MLLMTIHFFQFRSARVVLSLFVVLVLECYFPKVTCDPFCVGVSDRPHDHWSCTGSATITSACMPLVSWHPLLFICRPVSCGVYVDVNSTATRHRRVLSQLDLLRYWKGTSAYKNDVHFLLKHLDEKQRHRTLLHSVRSSVSLLRNIVQVEFQNVCCL